MILCSAVALCSCEQSDESEYFDIAKTFQPIEVTTEELTFIEEQNDFAMRLFSNIAQTETGNFVVSPLSLSINLSMMANGANGHTLIEMLSSLGFKESDLNAVNSLNKKLLKSLPHLDNTSSLSIANAIWHRSDRYPLSNFKNICDESYLTPLFNSYTLDKEALDRINEWVKNQTNGMICEMNMDTTLIGRSPLILLNGVSFGGKWRNPEKTEIIKSCSFTNTDESTSKIDFLSLTAASSYLGNQDFFATNLDYGNRAFSLTLICPINGKTITDISKTVSLSDLKYLTNDQIEASRIIRFPKISITSTTTFDKILTAMGIHDAFSIADADFSKALDSNFYLRDIKQKAAITFDEKGSKAEAVTQTLTAELIHPGVTITGGKDLITIDSPYFFIISEKSSGAIIFMGQVTKI